MAEPRVGQRVLSLGLHQMLWTACKAEAIVRIHDGGYLFGEVRIDIPRSPAHEKIAYVVVSIALRIPGHVEKELHADLAGLDISDIEHPEFVCAILEGFIHLLPNESRWRRVEPGIGGGGAVEPLDVIVNA